MGKDNWGLAPSSGGGDGGGGGGGNPLFMQREEHWRHFDNSVNAVSFGFVATAILISMFLVMAIFERFLRPRSSSTSLISSSSSGSAPNHHHRDLEAQTAFNTKLGHPSPKMSIYARGVSVLMPGEKIPTYIAHPAPAPCPPERTLCPPHQHNPSTSSSSNSNSI